MRNLKQYITGMVFLLLFAGSLIAGEAVDSLEHRLNLSDGNERIGILNALSVQCYEKGIKKKSLEYGEQALKLARQSGSRTEEVTALNNIGKAYHLHKKYDSAYSYYKKALTLAREYDIGKGKATALYNIGLHSYSLQKYDLAIDYFHQAYNIFEEIGDKIKTAKIFKNLGAIYSALKQYDKALYFYQKALERWKELDDKDEITSSYNNIGILYYRWGNFEKALESYQLALELRKKIGDKETIAESYNDIGFLYNKWGKYNKALEYYLYELKIREELADKNEIAATLSSIGKIYYDMANYEKAIEYYHKSLAIVEQISDYVIIAKSFTNIGNIYYDWKNYKKSLEYYHKSLKITERILKSSQTTDALPAKLGKAILLNNIGLIHKNLGNYLTALKYCKSSLVIKEKFGNNENKIFPITSIAEIYIKLGDFKQATEYASMSLDLAGQLVGKNKKTLIKNSYYLLYQVYSASEEYQKALDYHKMYTSIKDTLLNEETSKKIVEMEIKYETEKKAKENEERARDNERLRQSNIAQRTYFIVVSTLILILLIVIFNRYRNKQKANKMLSEKNLQILEQHTKLEDLFKQLTEKEKKLRDANATKDKFFSIIAHDLKNPLQSLLLSSDLLVRYRHKFNEMDLEKKHFYLRNTARYLSDLLDSLLQWARTQTGNIEYNPETIDLNIILLENINLLNGSAFKKNIKLVSRVKENSYAFADSNMITTVIRNFISNAIKFTPEGGAVTISCREFDNSIEFSVADSGVGIKEEDIKKLFRIDVHHTTLGTSEEKGTGLGLILCKEFVEKNDGKIFVESEVNKGSNFKFALPKKKK